MNGGLPLSQPLRNRGFKVLGLCAFGCEVGETVHHIFGECPLARAVWIASNIGIRLEASPGVSIKDFFSSFWLLAPTNEVDRNSIIPDFIQLCWTIYFHRNLVLFQGVSPDSLSVLNIFRCAKSNRVSSAWRHKHRHT